MTDKCINCWSSIQSKKFICDACTQLQNSEKRTELFQSILKLFREKAVEQDFNQLKATCESLANSLSTIDLIYTPKTTFNEITDSTLVDLIAQTYMNEQSRLEGFVPISSKEDGSCLYHSIKRFMPTMPTSLIELRVRAMIEITCNYDSYVQKYPDCNEVADDFNTYCQNVCDSTHSQLWDILGLCGSLKCRIRLIYAKNPPLHPALDAIYSPISNEAITNEIIIFWTNTMSEEDLRRTKKSFVPNHFVPLMSKKDKLLANNNIEMLISLRTEDIVQSALNLIGKKSNLKSLAENEVGTMAASNTDELFAIFYGSSMTAKSGLKRPNEKGILYLLLNYLLLKIDNAEETDTMPRIFSISDGQRNNMKTIFGILKQWLVDLTAVDMIGKFSEPNKDVHNYAIVLQKRIHNLQDICILPSGFAKTTWNSSCFPNFLMLETEYIGPYSAASIIELESKDFKRLIQIDPISSYQRSCRELTTDKIGLGLEISKIPLNNFDVNFLLLLMTLRTIPGDKNYESAYLYEIVLSKLGGKGNLRNEKEFFVKMEEKGFFSLSWTLVKNVFYYLLKKIFDSQEAHCLYVKIICEFQFTLLINSFNQYKKLETYDRLNRQKYHFLLHEMCNKVAYDAANCQEIKQQVIADYISMVQHNIDHNNQKLSEGKRNEKYIKRMTFQHNNFEQFLSENLKGLKFIQENITSNLASSIRVMLRKQFSFPTVNFRKDKSHVETVKFSQTIDELTKYYGINRVIQICQLIEDFVFSIAQYNGFRSWYGDEKCNVESAGILTRIANLYHNSSGSVASQSHTDEKSNVEIARILVRIASLYYNCSAIVASQLHPDENCPYEPAYYTKLVLILFSFSAMMEDLVRNDRRLGRSLKNYTISTELENISLKSALPQLALPERKWFDLLKKIEEYFKLSTTNVKQTTAKESYLFHYSSLKLDNNSHENNIDVIYTLNVLKNNFPDRYKKFEGIRKEAKVDEMEEKWCELLLTDEYMPDLLRCLRDISFLSQLSLFGFPMKYIEKIKSSSCQNQNMYSRISCIHYRYVMIFGSPIILYDFYDKRRFSNFMLSKEQNKYQRLIVFDCDQNSKNSLTENEIIGTQNEKPDNLTRPQYYRLCSMQLYDDLKFSLLYIALKNDEISFEIEEHCYLVKQTLHRLGTYDKMCVLEKQFQNENFARALVNKFVEIVLDLKERITQHKAIGHALDILLYLYDFCPDNTKTLIDECLAKLRVALLKYTNDEKNISNFNDNQTEVSILSSYYILTYKNQQMINEEEVSQILKLRILIENNSKLYSFMPFNFYIKIMTTLLNLSSKIENIIDNKLCLLNAYVESPNGLWIKHPRLNIYLKDCYSFVPLKGRLFKNGHPLLCLPSQIVNHLHYQECFGTQNFLTDIVHRNVFGQILHCYETKSKGSMNIRLSLLENDKIWIEHKNQTFVSKSYLSKLPKILLENSTYTENEKIAMYSHWYENNKIFIKNENKIVKFEIDLISNEIYSYEHKKFLIPFIKDGFDESNVLYTTFSRFEDENYILALKKRKQDSEPVIIYLPRLNLKFRLDGTRVISEDFKDYRLSQDQHINTLFGLSQYLVIEPDIGNDNPMKFNRKIIIPYHPIEKKEPFFSNIIQFNLDKIGRPAYFSYEIDENLEFLNSETTAGSLYLALLYFKTATLDKDLFLKMNGYETCAEILKTCWQNCAYSDIEFNIILKFFENKCPDLEKPWSNYAGLEQKMFSVATYGMNTHHRNTHAIFLRLIYLLLSSYQTDFLIKADVNKKNLYFYFLQKEFLKYHFNFYLIFKDRIDKRCRLSLEEEKKLLSSCVEKHSNSRVSDYYESINDKKELNLVSSDPADYKRLEKSFFSRTSISQCKFKEQVMRFFKKRFSSVHLSHYNKMCTVKNLFSGWVNIKFELSYFISLYRIALDIEGANDFNREIFSYFLAYLFLKEYENDIDYSSEKPMNATVFTRMLYIVSIFPKEFKPLPEFLLSDTNEINYNQSYEFGSDSMKLIESDIPNISNLDDAANKEVKRSIWLVLNKEYLNKEQHSKLSVKDLLDPDFKLKFQSSFESILKQKKATDISSHLPNTIYENIVHKRRNKEFYEFFIYISNQCEKIIKSHAIGYTVSNTTGLSNFKMSLSVNDIENQINKKYSYTEINENCILDLEWKVKSIDIKEHYKNLQKFFDIKSYYPENILFPLDPETLPEDSRVRTVFSNGYGKTFISDLEESYGQQSPIVKINEIYFFFSMKEAKTGIDLLKELGCDCKKELSSLVDNLGDIKKDLFLDVEQWIRNETSREYISESEREKINNISIEFEDNCKKINSEFIKRNILTEPLASEPLKQLLENYKNDANLKREARNWRRDLEDIEEEKEDCILKNNNIFELYLNYCCEQYIVSPSILKLIYKSRKIGFLVYEKLEKPTFELKIIENYSYTSNECNKQCQLWLKEDLFCQIEIKDIKDEKILENLKSSLPIVGYLQAPKSEIHLKAEYDINNVADVLVKYYAEYEKTNVELLEEIRRNISFITSISDETNAFRLHRIIGNEIIPTKKELLSLLKDINKIKEFNPFMMNQKQIFYEKIECHLVQETLIQQIKRVIFLISKYNSLDAKDHKDERERILENILTNILMERTYDNKVYPSWLLFETENNLLIRKTQYSLIKTMMDEEDNSIYQLNMGEGKTSVILIIFSEMLADGEQIVRINCLEPLMGVMQELLRNKFSGLLHKKIYVMPFSRGVVFSIENLEKIKEMLTECQNGKHILLVTPEQRLCFQLKKQEMFLEYLQSKDANDFFDWKEHYRSTHYCTINPNTPYALTESQTTLKQTLQSLGYIDNSDKIVKFPSEECEKFFSEVCKNNKKNRHFDIRYAYYILRNQSTQLKTQRKQKLDLLYKIDEFKFFDILDESDEILRHGKELNYTLGSAKPLDGGLIRWEMPFLLFQIIFCEENFGETLKQASQTDDCPIVFQENFRPVSGIGGGSPLVRFIKYEYFLQNIRPKLCQELTKILLSRFCEKQTNIVSGEGEYYGSYEDFVGGKCLFKEDKIIKLLKAKSQDMLNSFLLAKAWLSHELLYHVMSYRYRVEYGLSEKKEKETAIPFRGKDLPSENSEFSHPDIMIGFTILSYLYRGLDLKQVQDGLIKLKSDPKRDKDSLLREWVTENKKWIEEQIQKENEEFPEWLNSFKTLDLENEDRIKKAHLYLARNFSFIQYYLSNFTFPNDTKYYESKLTGNAHTLAGEGKTNGFSGTDDRNDTMPESIVPKRLPSQVGTNGKMLHILSRKMNQKYESKIEISSSMKFLDQVCEYAQNNKDCYIFIDAGAIITEMSNFDVSKYLIKNIDKRFDGVVYFSDKTNKIMVILRNEEYLSLSVCHIDNKKLFVYLDEVHTRGTDVKLPLTARGIVTLGKNMNKDKLMQAVMRLRDLDFKQSIVLWGSKEISAEIAIINGIKLCDITSKHVITWVTYNTIQKNESDLYLVMKEKLKYIIKSRALEYQKKIKEIPIHSLIIAYESENLDSIEESYGITPQKRNPRDLLNRNMSTYLSNFYTHLEGELKEKGQYSDLIIEFNKNQNDVDRPNMKRILEKVEKTLPNSILTINADMDSDQENEREIEEMQHVEVASVMKKAPPPQVIWEFDKIFEKNLKEKGLTGKNGYPKLKELRKCFEFTVTDDLRKLKWLSNVFATENFIKTVEEIDDKNKQYQNDYLKPVNMILIHRIDKEVCFVIVSLFEAQHLNRLCQEKKDPKVSIIHIDDVNGPSMVPINAVELTKEETNNVIAVIRLFNGDCHYTMEEISVIKRCVAIVDRDCLHEDKAISEKIYSELESRHYLTKGFITSKLATKLADRNEKILPETEAEHGIDLQSRFHLIINESIAEDADSVWKLPGLIRQLIKIRGKSEQYERSALKEILD